MVTGNITCASFIVNEGAPFDGNIIMKNLDKSERFHGRPAAVEGKQQGKDKEKNNVKSI